MFFETLTSFSMKIQNRCSRLHAWRTQDDLYLHAKVSQADPNMDLDSSIVVTSSRQPPRSPQVHVLSLKDEKHQGCLATGSNSHCVVSIEAPYSSISPNFIRLSLVFFIWSLNVYSLSIIKSMNTRSSRLSVSS